MPRTSWAIGCIVLAGASFLVAEGCQKPEQPTTNIDQGPKSVKLKLLLPDGGVSFDGKDAVITADDKKIEGQGDERQVKVDLAPGKDEVLLVLVWEPNNYTTITRPRKVKSKAGEIVVDFRSASDKEKDDIKVRFVPTPKEFVDAMCRLGKVGKDDVVYDLGCGDGRLVITAVRDFKAKRGVGVEYDPKLVKTSQDAVKEAGLSDKIAIREGDVLKIDDLSDATVILLYMGDDINARLKPILKKTLKPGSRVVSHRFIMGDDWPPDRSETVKVTMGDEYLGYEEQIHLWVIKGEKK